MRCVRIRSGEYRYRGFTIDRRDYPRVGASPASTAWAVYPGLIFRQFQFDTLDLAKEAIDEARDGGAIKGSDLSDLMGGGCDV